MPTVASSRSIRPSRRSPVTARRAWPAAQHAQVRAARSDLLCGHVPRPGAGGDLAWEVWNKRKNGKLYPQQLMISAVREGARFSQYIAIFSDLSQTKLAEQKIAAQANYDNLTRPAQPLAVRSLSGPLLREGGALRPHGARPQQLQGGQQQHGSPWATPCCRKYRIGW